MREERDHVVYAPGFERDLEQPIAGAVAVPPEAELVVTEGNYLLLDDPEWRAVRAQLDEVVFLVTDDDTRIRRLVDRHVEFGKTPRRGRGSGWPGSTRPTPPWSPPPPGSRTGSWCSQSPAG